MITDAILLLLSRVHKVYDKINFFIIHYCSVFVYLFVIVIIIALNCIIVIFIITIM